MNALTTRTLVLLVALMGFGCGETADTTVESDTAPIQISNGRADSNGLVVSNEEVEAVLDIVNTYTLGELDSMLDVRAARNIVEARQSSPIATIAELDAIPYVGMRAFERLLDEAQTFVGDSKTYDIADYLSIEGDRSKQLVFRGELKEQLLDQPFVAERLLCRDDSCSFPYYFESVNDYRDRAEPGHVVVSFRSDELAGSERTSSAFRQFARNVNISRAKGPMQCKDVGVNPNCVGIYGNSCVAQYRCSITLPK